MNLVPAILFENGDLLVVDKPQGLLTHGDGRSENPAVTDWLEKEYPEIIGVGEPWTDQKGVPMPRPGIVHRLDRETSGVLIIAKNEKTYDWLKQQFKDRTVKKEYRTFVHGIIVEAEGKIDRPIGRSSGDFRRYSAQRGAKGEMRDALTRYKVLERITVNTKNYTDWNSNGYTYIAAFPETGRTHQIRVHLKAIHHPVVADTFYGGALGTGLGFSSLALHAYRIEVPLPDGSRKRFEASLRPDFIAAASL
jgi:23S rRNA pseudouridine1911/1915/1917 synthase